MLNFRIKKPATSAVADAAVVATKTAWKPLVYDSSMAVFLGSALAMLWSTKMKRSESRAMSAGRPAPDSAPPITFWKTVPDSLENGQHGVTYGERLPAALGTEHTAIPIGIPRLRMNPYMQAAIARSSALEMV